MAKWAIIERVTQVENGVYHQTATVIAYTDSTSEADVAIRNGFGRVSLCYCDTNKHTPEIHGAVGESRHYVNGKRVS